MLAARAWFSVRHFTVQPENDRISSASHGSAPGERAALWALLGGCAVEQRGSLNSKRASISAGGSPRATSSSTATSTWDSPRWCERSVGPLDGAWFRQKARYLLSFSRQPGARRCPVAGRYPSAPWPSVEGLVVYLLDCAEGAAAANEPVTPHGAP